MKSQNHINGFVCGMLLKRSDIRNNTKYQTRGITLELHFDFGNDKVVTWICISTRAD